ncbi:hypothetical protein ACFPTY_09545 [Halomonas beimenensis]|uniref:hypothetical protein n=1 Tax=Halomonas beimenensis TaxID=475662 RepID=UPI000BEF120E|nr:hypothetical protein [Halomonas beimenensis]
MSFVARAFMGGEDREGLKPSAGQGRLVGGQVTPKRPGNDPTERRPEREASAAPPWARVTPHAI